MIVVRAVTVGWGLVFVGFGMALLAGGFSVDFATRDTAQIIGAVLGTGGVILAAIGILCGND